MSGFAGKLRHYTSDIFRIRDRDEYSSQTFAKNSLKLKDIAKNNFPELMPQIDDNGTLCPTKDKSE
jgi:hypothetical protein